MRTNCLYSQWQCSGGVPNGWEYRIRVDVYDEYLEVFQEFKDKEECHLGEFQIEMLENLLRLLFVIHQNICQCPQCLEWKAQQIQVQRLD